MENKTELLTPNIMSIKENSKTVQENQAELYIGRVRASMRCVDENEKKILEELTAEANKEFNKLLISFGRLDERMLLFFMLLNLQMQITKTVGKNTDFIEVFSNVLNFIKPSTNIERQLLFGIIYKKNELRKILKSGKKFENSEANIVENFNKFVETTMGKIKNLMEINI